MPEFTIEIAADGVPATCRCCGEQSTTGHGLVYRNGEAYAAYKAAWAAGHRRKAVSLVIGLADWDGDGPGDGRAGFGVTAYALGDTLGYRVADSEETPWEDTDIPKGMLARTEALSHPRLKDVFAVAEHVIRGHPALRQYLAVAAEAERRS